jgi:diguanylate cyclase (GGDEF)-like protein
VLIADDDPVPRLLAARALEALGYEVEQVDDGEAALAALEVRCPDLVILDVEMPGRSGFETCAELRRRPASRELPVLIATGLADTETIDQALSVGASDFIKKPLDWQLLQHRARFLLSASGMVQDLRRTLADLSDSRTRLANAQRIARLGSWEWIPGERRMRWSDELYHMLGRERGRDSSSLDDFVGSVHVEDRASIEKVFRDAEVERKGWTLDHRICGVDGEVRIVRQNAEVETSPDGTFERICGTLQDITDRRRAEQQIRELAYYDSLTALPNRRMLAEVLEDLLGPTRVAKRPLALMIVNLERFARVNDTLGHRGGDEILTGVAERLQCCVDDPELRPRFHRSLPLARIGSDEFSVLLAGIRTSDEAAFVARRILQSLEEPFSIGGNEIVMNARIGIATHPDDGASPEELLRNANTAMHHAKAQREDIHFFRAVMNERATRNLSLESGLRSAIERDEFLLNYQPLWDARSRAVCGFEALVRWDSRDFGLVMPAEFIPLAEEGGFIRSLGDWVLREACRQARLWLDEGLDLPRISVNVSSVQLRDPDLSGWVRSFLEETGLPPALLEIEITESALLEDETSVAENLESFREAGARIALDDFGTGFSSLSHLMRYPIDTLKVDQSFVRAIGDGGQTEPLIAAVVAMAHGLGLHVVAEGVETAEQESFLREVGCDALQGFRLARPLSADEVVRLLSDHAKSEGLASSRAIGSHLSGAEGPGTSGRRRRRD